MKKLEIFCATFLITCITQSAEAIYIDPNIPIQTQIVNFGPLSSDVFLPLTDSSNSSSLNGSPATVDNYGWVKSQLFMTLSQNLQSTGTAFLGKLDQDGQTVAGDVVDGEILSVNRSFNFYFDLTITDNDTTASFFGGQGPQSLTVQGLGAWQVQFDGTCIADTSWPNLGCLSAGGVFTSQIPFKELIPLG